MLYTVSADALQRFRLMLDTPAHEGVERGRAAVQGGHGGPQRRANGDGGDPGRGREPANGACVAGSLRARGHGGDGRPVAPSSESVVTDDTQDEEMAVRRERAVAHNPGKDLEGQGFTPLANIGSGFGDLSDKAEDGGPNLTEPKRLIARPHLDDERTILIDLARVKRKHRVGLPACRSQVR